jgi:hypothetical protein
MYVDARMQSGLVVLMSRIDVVGWVRKEVQERKCGNLCFSKAK